MKLIKDERAWKRWSNPICRSQDHQFDPPKEYPCFAYLTVLSFGYEEEAENYLYREDTAKMSQQLATP